ncbi:hypothetical protein D9M68_754310 [compost metagenome]
MGARIRLPNTAASALPPMRSDDSNPSMSSPSWPLMSFCIHPRTSATSTCSSMPKRASSGTSRVLTLSNRAGTCSRSSGTCLVITGTISSTTATSTSESSEIARPAPSQRGTCRAFSRSTSGCSA